jgi:hypothetical protein
MISLLMVNSACAMETDGGNNKDLQLSSSSSDSQSNSLSEFLMSYAPTKESLCNAYGAVTTSVGFFYDHAVLPAYTTVSIKSSDDIAFIKLGYPITDIEAQKELRKNLDNYINYYNFKQQLLEKKADYKNAGVSREYDSLHELIMRRKEFVDRAAYSLPFRLDGIALAQHCLMYHDHEPVMTAPIKNIISLFIINKTKAEREAALSFSVQLEQLIKINKLQKAEEKDKDGK